MHDLKRPIEVPELGPDVPRWEKGDEDLLFPMAVGKMTIRLTPEAFKRVRYQEDDRSMGNSTITIPGLFPHMKFSSAVRDTSKKSLTLTCYEHLTKGVCFYGATLMEFWQILREHIKHVRFEIEMEVLPGMVVRQGNDLIGEKGSQLLMSCVLDEGKVRVICCSNVEALDLSDTHSSDAKNHLHEVWGWGVIKLSIKREWTDHIGVINGLRSVTQTQSWHYEPESDESLAT